MAHSYIYVKKNLNTERSVAVPDGALILFMYFFNEASKQKDRSNKREIKIFRHYEVELLEVHTSYIDLMLQKIFEDPQLKSWYLLTLAQIDLRLNDFGEYISHDYLNQIPKLGGGYTRLISITTLKNLVNDIIWVLYEVEYIPSGQYKWFETN